jgi:HAD superfamily hydrolase (TIGR01509 family)
MSATSQKSGLRGVRAIVFDMDGVLIDSEPLHLLAYQRFLADFGLTFLEEDNHNFLGMKDVDCAKHLLERHKLDITALEFVAKKEAVLHTLFLEQLKIQPGVLKTLEHAQRLNIPSAIASSATMPTIELVVEITGTRKYFRHLCSGDEVPNGKPAPDVFLLAAERLSAKPSECLVIEDTFNGVCAAKAAGMMCIAIPCQATRHQDFAHADLVLNSMDEVDLEELIAPRSLA